MNQTHDPVECDVLPIRSVSDSGALASRTTPPAARLRRSWPGSRFSRLTADGTHTGLIIEARTYSNPGDICWIDDFYVAAPSCCEVVVMEGGTAAMEDTWSEVKALY